MKKGRSWADGKAGRGRKVGLRGEKEEAGRAKRKRRRKVQGLEMDFSRKREKEKKEKGEKGKREKHKQLHTSNEKICTNMNATINVPKPYI